jgi:ribosomal protein L28
MKQCKICAKKRNLARRLNKLRGKYNPAPKKRKQKPNLQWVKIPIGIKKPMFKNFAGKRILACTKCIKTLAKRK